MQNNIQFLFQSNFNWIFFIWNNLIKTIEYCNEVKLNYLKWIFFSTEASYILSDFYNIFIKTYNWSE